MHVLRMDQTILMIKIQQQTK